MRKAPRTTALVLAMAATAGPAATLALATIGDGDPQPRLADYYGFQPLEIYKLDNRINGLVVADLDGDRTADIAVINNARSRLDLLLSSPGANEDDAPLRADTNSVPSSKRMRLKTVPVNQAVASLVAGDFDSDGKTDLALYGSAPAEIQVLLGQGAGRFASPRRIPVSEAVESTSALATGDLNRDGKADLVLVTPKELITVLQGDKGKLLEPERLAHTASQPSILKAVDLDGDGGDDLCLLDGGSTDDPIRVRFSVEGGRLGPEQRFKIENPRAIAYADLDGKPGVEVLAVEGQSGRARVFTLDDSADDDEANHQRGRLLFFPLPAGDARGRALATGDLDGDGKPDVVVTDPGNAQFLVYLQGPSGLARGLSFPSLAGGRALDLADLDGDGKAEVYVLSETEKQIGRSLLQDGRLSFPAPLPISGDPVALDVADLDADGKPEVLYIARGDGKEGFQLRALKRGQDGAFVPFRWGQTDAVPLPGLTGTPPAIRVLDVNRDGQTDVLVFKAVGSPLLLLGRAGGEPPAPAAGSLGPLVGSTPAGVSLKAPGDASLLVAQNSFARSVVLKGDGQWEVKDQFNAGRGTAQILGATSLDADGDGKQEVVLLDKASKSLLFLDERDGAYRPGGTLSVGPLDFTGLQVADLDGDKHDDLILAGTDKFGVVLTGRKGQRLRPLASYETTRKDALLGDLIAGDLNGDGKPDLVITDVGEHVVELVAFDGKAELDRALAFKIFEKKSFRDRDSLVEPRDLALGDVDGDGRTDLILIVHDRILVYRQDDGSAPAVDDKAKAKDSQ